MGSKAVSDEKAFHAARVMWFFDGARVIEALRGDTRGHSEWIGPSWLSVVRGFTLHGKVTIYQGNDFAEPDCSQGVLDAIMDHFGVRECGLGCVVGEVGEVWCERRIARRSEETKL